MSLDVYLEGPEENASCCCPNCGNGHDIKTRDTYFEANITHNLGRMAEEGGFYLALWRPEELGIVDAQHLGAFIDSGIRSMRADPLRFRIHDATNRWGTLAQFLPWLERLRDACFEHPKAHVRASR